MPSSTKSSKESKVERRLRESKEKAKRLEELGSLTKEIVDFTKDNIKKNEKVVYSSGHSFYICEEDGEKILALVSIKERKISISSNASDRINEFNDLASSYQPKTRDFWETEILRYNLR